MNNIHSLEFLFVKYVEKWEKTIPVQDLERQLIAFVLDVMPSFFMETAVHVAKAKRRFCAQWESQMDDSGPSVRSAADDGRRPDLSSWTTEPTDNTYRYNVTHD